MSPTNRYEVRRRPHIGLGAVLAILAAMGSLAASFTGNEIVGLILGLVAIPLGLAGVVSSLSASLRSSIVSILAIGLAVISVLVAIVVLVFWH